MQLEFRSFFVWRRVAGWLLTDVLKDLSTLVCRVKRCSSWTAWPWNLRQCSTSERRVLYRVQNLMAHGDARVGKWRGKMRMEWVVSNLALYVGTRSIQLLSNYPHSSTASSRLNWHRRRFKWTRPFRWKTKSGFCACAITFRTCYTYPTTRRHTLKDLNLQLSRC